MRRTWCSIVLITIFPSAGHLLAQEETGKEFQRNVLLKWKIVLESIKTARWDVSIEYFDATSTESIKAGPTRIDTVRLGYRQDRGEFSQVKSKSFHEDKAVQKRETREYVELSNMNYSAQIKKALPRDGWVLGELNLSKKELADRLATNRLCPWMSAGNRDLFDWVAKPGFVITRLERSPADAISGSVRAHFTFEGMKVDRPDPVKSGYVDIDPSHSYRPTKYRYNLNSETNVGFIEGILEYAEGNGIPVLRKTTSDSAIRYRKRPLASGRDIHMYSNVEYNGSIADAEFRLSHYGLPEPMGMPPVAGGARWHIWLSLAAAGSLCLALLCVAIRRRYLSPQAPSV